MVAMAVDVFAFSALVLEVLAGRRPIEPRAPPEELMLAEWAWERYAAREVQKVVDARLDGAYDAAEVAVAVKVGLWCSHPSPAMWPTMREVARYLDGGEAGEVPEPPYRIGSNESQMVVTTAQRRMELGKLQGLALEEP